MIKSMAENVAWHGVEVRFKDLGPTTSVCFAFEVKYKGLKSVLVVDTVGEDIFFAWFASTDKVHLVEIMQIGYSQSIALSVTYCDYQAKTYHRCLSSACRASVYYLPGRV